jgi:hypothetical protein
MHIGLDAVAASPILLEDGDRAGTRFCYFLSRRRFFETGIKVGRLIAVDAVAVKKVRPDSCCVVANWRLVRISMCHQPSAT